MTDSQPIENNLLVFGMKNLMIENALSKLEDSGIEIGHSSTIKKDELVDTDLFEHVILKKAKKMADFYVLYFSLENSVRKLIADVLGEKHGVKWWNQDFVPKVIVDAVKTKMDEEKDTPMSKRSEDPLAYTSFGELIAIIELNWEAFSDILRSLKSVKKTLAPLSDIRNVIAHSCELSDDDISRFKLLIKDWFRIQIDNQENYQ